VGKWVVARSAEDAVKHIRTKGMPRFISFDHDLGKDAVDGHGLAIYIVEKVLDGELDIPPEFDFYVHSQNPVGRANIEGLLRNFLDHLAFPDGVPLDESVSVA
jgi:hypothetical protein